MIGWSLVSSRLFSEQGACRGLRPEPSGDEPLDLSEPEDLGESGPFEERSAPRTKADLLREIRQRADRRTGQQEAEQRQIDPWQAQPPQRRGHGR